ncbi:MAG TPA: PAS domain-containing protein [Ramlibacter sp.]|jgi:PAS domain S-box-containing protein|uniref:hybrid sensor histidine kinase/response regulator n=1 Tax=Ramlibacter sp. TaxID=1917967 RepID=UPI002D66475F|nr:PAS domain-containing protein [Ramlibacter sp.]HZY19844.1 PAS domain-containing protein [Ramlibacter sp.]
MDLDVPSFEDPRVLAGAIVQASDDVVFAKDLQGRYRFANPAALAALDRPAAEVLGRTDVEILGDTAAARRMMAADRQVFTTGDVLATEVPMVQRAGGVRYWHTRKLPLRAAGGELVGVLGIGRDITERRLAEAQQESARLKLQMAIQAAGLVTAEIDYVHNENHISAELARLLELGDDAMVVPRQAIFDRVHPDDRQRYLDAVAAAIDPAGKGHLAISVRALLPSGKLRWLHIRLQVTFGWLDGERRALRGMCAARDATAEMEAQEALRISEARFRAAVQAASDILWTADPAGRMHGPQPGWAAFTGQTQQAYAGHGWAQAVHPDDVQPTLDAWQAAVAAETRFVFEHRVRRHDGVYRTFSIRAQPTQETGGGVREWVGVHTDITELLAAGQARREAEERYRQLFENMTEEVHFWQLVRDAAGRIETWRLVDANGPALATWGRRLEDIRGRTADEIFGPGTTEDYRPIVERVFREQRPASYDDYFERLGRHFRFTTVPLGESFISTGMDISAIHAAQRTIERQNLELREADARKDRFLATLSHELRNPLAPIRTAADLLGRPGLAPEQLAVARQVIQRQVRHMALLLDDLLDVARVTQSKLELRRERVELGGIVDSAVEAVRPLVDRKQHRLEIDLPASMPVVDADPLRLSQVLANLLTNAAKYTDPGGRIALRARVEADVLVLEVQDDGIGIAPDALPRLFEMFAQLRESADRSEGGLGVGLALVKGLVGLHGGSVQASSEGPGRGSTFAVRLPLPADPARPSAASGPAAAAGGGRKVLVADDNRDAADTLAMLLGMGGHDVRVAYDGLAAVSAAQAFRPEVALLDIGMPGLSGHEVARALRQEPWAGALTLVAVTGWGQQDDRNAAREAGFDHHLTKPVDPSALERLLAGLGTG